MRMGAVLEQVYSLPDAQAQFIFLHWYGQVGLGERRPHMRWHVVWALCPVLKKGVAIGNQSVKKSFQIFQNVGVGIFLNQQRRRCMRNE